MVGAVLYDFFARQIYVLSAFSSCESSSVLLRLLCHRKSQHDVSVFNGSYYFSATNARNAIAAFNSENAKPEEAALD